MLTKENCEIEKKLEQIAQDIAIPESKYEDAKKEYEALGEWLADGNSNLKQYNPKIYPQGSFALGSAIKPQEGCEYDVDLICLFQKGLNTSNISQKELKRLVGERIKAHGTYSKLLDPKEGSRRCWTLKYSDQSRFHMDILPAIPDEWAHFNEEKYRAGAINQAIFITDKKHKDYENITKDWLKSNPQGYINWFYDQMRTKMMQNRKIMLGASESVKELPSYKRGTTLQKAIQLLKYHRDINFGQDEDKPISIIITTLATKAYSGEDNLFEALKNICANMQNYIEISKNNVYRVENPVNSEENFADKWQECPRKREIFFKWLKSLNLLFEELLNENVDISETIDRAYGRKRQNKINEAGTVFVPRKSITLTDTVKPWCV